MSLISAYRKDRKIAEKYRIIMEIYFQFAFRKVFSNFGAAFLDSPYVFSVIVGLFMIYTPLMIWARRMDKRDKIKVSDFASIFSFQILIFLDTFKLSNLCWQNQNITLKRSC